jgi:Ca2+-binding EF-hand superfamily protein
VSTYFEKFDKNQDGFLDCEEIMELLRYTYLLQSQKKIELPAMFFRDAAESMIRKSGNSEEGRLSREAFFRLYTQAP